MADKITLKIHGRLQFCDTLLEQGKDKKKEAVFLIPKNQKPPASCADIEEVKKVIVAAARSKFGQTADLKSIKLGLKDGDKQKHSETGEIYRGYEGCWALNASTWYSVGFFRKVNGETTYVPLDQLETYFYAGAYVIANISFEGKSFKDKENGMTVKYVARFLNGLLFCEHGESLGGRKNDETLFDGVEGFDSGDAENPENYDGELEETPQWEDPNTEEVDPF